MGILIVDKNTPKCYISSMDDSIINYLLGICSKILHEICPEYFNEDPIERFLSNPKTYREYNN